MPVLCASGAFALHTYMNILLLGHGKMGHEIEHVAREKGTHAISVTLAEKGGTIDATLVKAADVIVDFTSPEVVLQNIRAIVSAGKNMVIGTTGWYDHLPTVEDIVRKSGVGLVYGANFSIGAHIFLRLIAHATRMTSVFGTYDTYGLEVHHAGKKDSPSGTALRAAKEVLDNSSTKKVLQTARLDREIHTDELHFASVRGGRNPGFHQVVFDSAVDSITISHAAHNRRGFAEGSILAAEFIQDKKGLFTFDDVMQSKHIV